MRRWLMRITGASICAVVLALGGAVVVAQSETFVGCVQKESSVLKRKPVAANIGMEDEFVLTFAKAGPAAAADAPKPDAPPEPAAAAAAPGNFGTVYRVTGDKEKELKSLVGQRVEITGTIKDKVKAT